MATELVVILVQVLADEEEEMITASDDEEEIYLMVAILTFTKRKLNRNRFFFVKLSYQAIRWMCWSRTSGWPEPHWKSFAERWKIQDVFLKETALEDLQFLVRAID